MRALSRKNAALFFGAMQRMIASGVPIDRSFTLIADGQYPLSLKRAAVKMKDDVSRGLSVHEIFKGAGPLFRQYEVDIIGAACESGRMDQCLGMLAKAAEQEHQLRAKVVRALVYPVFILIASLFLLPIPIFFSDGPQAYLMALGKNSVVFLGIPAALVVIVKLLRNSAAWTPFSYFLNAVPLLGTLLRKIALTRFLRILGAMFASGVPVGRATQMAASTMDYPPLSNPVLKGISSISEGGTLSSMLALVPRFPAETLEMVKVGEESGTVGENLDRCAGFMEESVQHALSIITAILGPLFLVAIGLTIGYRIFKQMGGLSFTLPDLPME